MKKQILTLSVCLALTATSAFAATTPAAKTAKPSTQVTSKQVSKPALKQCPKPVVNTVEKKVTNPQEPCLTPEQAAKKKFEEKMAQHREKLYTDLCLSPEQKVKAEALDVKTRKEAEPLMKKFHEEKMKLKDLKAKNACEADIKKQYAEMKTAKKALKTHFKTSNAEFKALLTKEQLAKFEEIQKARKEEMKKYKKLECKDKCHKHHKHKCKHYDKDNAKAPYHGTKPCPCDCPQPPSKEDMPKCPCEK